MLFILERRSTVAVIYLDHVPFLSIVLTDLGGGLIYGSTDLTDAMVERGSDWSGDENMGWLVDMGRDCVLVRLCG